MELEMDCEDLLTQLKEEKAFLEKISPYIDRKNISKILKKDLEDFIGLSIFLKTNDHAFYESFVEEFDLVGDENVLYCLKRIYNLEKLKATVSKDKFIWKLQIAEKFANKYNFTKLIEDRSANLIKFSSKERDFYFNEVKMAWEAEKDFLGKTEDILKETYNKVLHFSKNAMENDNVRYGLYAAVAIGLAVASSDVMAGDAVQHLKSETGGKFMRHGISVLKELSGKLDNYNSLDGIESSCKLGVEIIKQNGLQLKANIFTGDKMISVEISDIVKKVVHIDSPIGLKNADCGEYGKAIFERVSEILKTKLN
jgi:hypothetical protein